jgi:hypothetical protein
MLPETAALVSPPPLSLSLPPLPTPFPPSILAPSTVHAGESSGSGPALQMSRSPLNFLRNVGSQRMAVNQA